VAALHGMASGGKRMHAWAQDHAACWHMAREGKLVAVVVVIVVIVVVVVVPRSTPESASSTYFLCGGSCPARARQLPSLDQQAAGV
jgi:hypothetical protein